MTIMKNLHQKEYRFAMVKLWDVSLVLNIILVLEMLFSLPYDRFASKNATDIESI